MVGGKEVPGSNGDIGAYVAKVLPGGAAEQTGKILEGMVFYQIKFPFVQKWLQSTLIVSIKKINQKRYSEDFFISLVYMLLFHAYSIFSFKILGHVINRRTECTSKVPHS